MMEIVFISWLVLLSVALAMVGHGTFEIRRMYMEYDRREMELNQAERMQRVIDLMSSHKQIRDKQIRRAVEALVAALTDDPLTCERYWSQLQALRNILAEP